MGFEVMRDAQGEEFKHFAMDLEFLLRRTPAWREVAQGILFKTGDIVERGEAAAVFHGWNDAITGISQASPHKQVSLGKKADAYPSRVAGAVERLLCEGITGPYGLALGREQYRLVVETAEHGGYPLLPARTSRLATTRTTAKAPGYTSRRASAFTSRLPRRRWR